VDGLLFLVDTIMDATDERSRAGRGGVDKGNSEGGGGGYMLFVCDSVLGRISEYIVDLPLWVLYRIILVLTLSKHGTSDLPFRLIQLTREGVFH